MNVIDFFDYGASLEPDAIAFVQGEREFSYGEVRALSTRIAGAIVGRTDQSTPPKVAIYSPNDTVAFTCLLGTFRAGGTWLPVNARGSVEGNVEFLQSVGAEVLFYHSEFAGAIEVIRGSVPTVTQTVCIDRPCGDDPSLDQYLDGYDENSAPRLTPDPERVVAILGTGGATGKSKGVMLTDLNWETMISQFSRLVETPEQAVHLVVAPMTHGAGALCYILLSMGAKTVVLGDTKPASILAAIEEHRVTHLFLPPTAFYALLAQPEVGKHDYSSLRYFLVSAAPVSPDKIRQGIEVFGPSICQCWGQTEAPMILTWMPPEVFAKAAAEDPDHPRLLSCGKGLMLSRVEVMDEEGNLLPRGNSGELVARSNLVTPGYYQNAEATAEISEHGWHHTGDIGYQDEQGYFYIVDRKKDMIVTGGFNVFGAEVEKAINAHPDVIDCAVIGVPDEKWGEAIKGVVLLKPGSDVSEEALIALCKERLGSVKAPKSVDFVEELPRSPVGKVLKRAIRERYWGDRRRRVS